MPEMTPEVSVVVATYNRAQCLRYTVASILAQSFADLELIVVGDACSDETEEMLDSFDDPRLRFVNLDENVGEQSGPNNAGVAMARGRLVAFCNHDDLWFPDHLQRGIEHMDATGADLVTSLFVRLRPDGDHELGWVMPRGHYVPYSLVPASSWLLRRELATTVGPWRYFRDCFDVPSQDWLLRAYKAGARIEQTPSLTMIALQSDVRPGVYARREFAENRDVWQAIRDDCGFRERLAVELARRHALFDRRGGANWEVWPFLRHAVRNALVLVLYRLGIHPGVARLRAMGTRRGGVIDALRASRGLPEIDRGKRHKETTPS